MKIYSGAMTQIGGLRRGTERTNLMVKLPATEILLTLPQIDGINFKNLA